MGSLVVHFPLVLNVQRQAMRGNGTGKNQAN